jgi:hypothetical protein
MESGSHAQVESPRNCVRELAVLRHLRYGNRAVH